MERKDNRIIADVAAYYSGKLAAHGSTPRGVDWNSEEGQNLRFKEICRIIDRTKPFSINDIGCGYGALVDYLSIRGLRFTYQGCDVSEEMIRAAQEKHDKKANAVFAVGSRPPTVADYTVASGIFNVRLQHSDQEWKGFIESTLETMHETSTHGFAFNCLTSYSDKEKMRSDLYYANPAEMFDFCMRKYSRRVALLHDYELYEFTILVRK